MCNVEHFQRNKKLCSERYGAVLIVWPPFLSLDVFSKIPVLVLEADWISTVVEFICCQNVAPLMAQPSNTTQEILLLCFGPWHTALLLKYRVLCKGERH